MTSRSGRRTVFREPSPEAGEENPSDNSESEQEDNIPSRSFRNVVPSRSEVGESKSRSGRSVLRSELEESPLNIRREALAGVSLPPAGRSAPKPESPINVRREAPSGRSLTRILAEPVRNPSPNEGIQPRIRLAEEPAPRRGARPRTEAQGRAEPGFQNVELGRSRELTPSRGREFSIPRARPSSRSRLALQPVAEPVEIASNRPSRNERAPLPREGVSIRSRNFTPPVEGRTSRLRSVVTLSPTADERLYRAEPRPVRPTPSSEKKSTPRREEKDNLELFGNADEWCDNLATNKIIITEVAKARSNCVIAFARQKGVINPKEIVIKITFKDTPTNNSFTVERKIYKNIIPELLSETPHLVKYVDDFVCDRFVNALKIIATGINPTNRFNAAAILGGLKKVVNKDRYHDIKDISLEPIYALFTERAAGQTVDTWINSYLYNKIFTPDQRFQFDKNVLLQVAHTLTIFERKLMRHNDLHTENVYVEEIERTVMKEYKLNGKEYSTIYFTRIFDFDHASLDIGGKDNPYENTYLNNRMCTLYGECNMFLPKWDWFTFLDEYQTILRNNNIDYNRPELPDYWKKWFPDWQQFPPDELFSAEGENNTDLRAFRGRSCFCNNKECSSCTVNETYLNNLPSPREFIEKNY